MARVRYFGYTKTIEKRRTILFALALTGFVVAAFCAVKLLDWYRTTQLVVIPSAEAIVTQSDSTPNEAEIDTTKETYTVAADQPRLISLPTVNASGFIQRVGIDQYGAIATPSNIHLAGWYTGSVKPGDVGVSVVDGHVHGRFKPAIFHMLHKLQPGDPIEVVYGDGTTLNFTVVKTAQYDLGNAAQHLLEKLPAIERQLTLITCGGTYDSASASYDQRLFVYAEYRVAEPN